MQNSSIKILLDPIEKIVINRKYAKILKDLIGDQIIDIVFYMPINFIFSSHCIKWEELSDKMNAILKVKIKSHFKNYRVKNSPYIITAIFDYKTINLIFFSKYTGYLKKVFPINSEILINGKVDIFNKKYQISHPEIISYETSNNTIFRKVIYRQKGGVKSNSIERIILNTLKIVPNLEEWNEDLKNYLEFLPSWRESINSIHRPDSLEMFKKDSVYFNRLAYDEMLANQISLEIIRNNFFKKSGNAYIKSKKQDLLSFCKTLPYKLTKDQSNAIKEILNDLDSEKMMLRLLQGDVGSGKTIVSLITSLFVLKSNFQVAIMVPTELLAKQHYKVATNLFKLAKINIACLVSSTKNKNEEYRKISNGYYSLIIGTHALIQEKLKFKNLGYVIIDEQHRFGVNQRLKMRNKGKNVDMLLLSATPIPRTILLTTLGDINVSKIQSKPFKSSVSTILKSVRNIDEVMSYLEVYVSRNKKVFWVCPMIDNNTDSERSNVEDRFKELKKRFKSIGILHGRMEPEAKETILEDFKSGQINLLISTVVIEVGIDIPSATVIVIEQPEYFGLAQIHQLRGRVGRSDNDGVCILLYKDNLSEMAIKRLNILKNSTNGFEIAEQDFKMRGGGEVLGKRQFGEENYIFFDIDIHHKFVGVAALEAKKLISQDPKLLSARGQKLINLLYIFKKNKAINMISAG